MVCVYVYEWRNETKIKTDGELTGPARRCRPRNEEEKKNRRMNEKRTNERREKRNKKKSYVFWFRIQVITEVPSWEWYYNTRNVVFHLDKRKIYIYIYVYRYARVYLNRQELIELVNDALAMSFSSIIEWLVRSTPRKRRDWERGEEKKRERDRGTEDTKEERSMLKRRKRREKGDLFIW